MRWLKRDRWKAGIAITGVLLLLMVMVWAPVSAAGTYERASGLAGPGTVMGQATPTEDATVTALNKEKLEGDVAQQQHTLGNWLWSNAATILSSFLSTLVIVIGALVGLWRWRMDQRTELEKRADERFQSAVTGLGDEKEGARIGAAILLRTFLRPGYERFYTQTFDLAVANLCLPRTSHPPADPIAPLPLTTLSQALIVVFREAFPLARSQDTRGPGSLDATGIQLDNAYLRGADLKQVWMPQASLRKVDLSGTDLSEAKLSGAKLSGAKLNEVDLTRADLSGADLSEAELIRAKLNGTDLNRTYFHGADLSGADLSGADLRGAKLSRVDLSWAKLSGAYLSGAELNGANLSEADFSGADLRGTTFHGVVGLTKGQLETFKARGALIHEDSTASSSQSSASPPSLS